MICSFLYFKIPKHSTRKLIDLINAFRKVPRQQKKINMQNSVSFLNSNNELSKKIPGKVTFTVPLKTV